MLSNDDYIDLFLTSDGLIHNSGSFITEYLVTGKPPIYILQDEDYMIKNSKYSKISIKWNAYGKAALSKHYLVRKQEEIEEVKKKTIINGDDYKEKDRKDLIWIDLFLLE